VKAKAIARRRGNRPAPPMSNFKTLFDDTNILKLRTESKTPCAGIRRPNPSIWVDKYRPRNLDDVIGHDDIKNVIKNAIDTGDLPHLLLYGMPGTGKTSITHAMIRELYGDNDLNVLELNASDENGINVVRDKIIRFASLEAARGEDDDYPEFKIIILDEADSMTSEAQTALKKAMEKTCKITRFVIICNYENKIIEAIRSRCASFRFNPIPNDKMIEKLKEIAETEGMQIEDDDVYSTITEICEGDARRSINTLQNLKYIPIQQMNEGDIRMDTVMRNMPTRLRREVLGPKPVSMERVITIDDVYLITSSIDYEYFEKYWRKIVRCPDAQELNSITHSIVIEGYPMDFVLKFFRDRVLDSKLADRDKAEILIYIGNVERMLVNGAGNHIQTMGVLTLIVSKFKGFDIRVPNIY
jgi:DNA polymerase III delta prime subunit